MKEKGEKMRLIDADALKVDYIVPSTTTNTACYPYVSYFQIKDAPTVDAEPVVRCGECRYYRNGGCLTGRYDLKDNDFCSLGEKI